MTVKEIFELRLIKDTTIVWIRNDLKVVARGNWYQDNILYQIDREVESFVWQDDDNIYIDVK